MTKITDEEFSEPGGGSRRLMDKSAPPEGGFFTSFADDKGGHSTVVSGADLPKHIGEHYEQSQSFFNSPQFAASGASKGDIYQGKWVDGGTGYLDISRHFPGNSTSSRKAALMMGINHEQIAVWNANKDKEERLRYSDGSPTPLRRGLRNISRNSA